LPTLVKSPEVPRKSTPIVSCYTSPKRSPAVQSSVTRRHHSATLRSETNTPPAALREATRPSPLARRRSPTYSPPLQHPPAPLARLRKPRENASTSRHIRQSIVRASYRASSFSSASSTGSHARSDCPSFQNLAGHRSEVVVALAPLPSPSTRGGVRIDARASPDIAPMRRDVSRRPTRRRVPKSGAQRVGVRQSRVRSFPSPSQFDGSQTTHMFWRFMNRQNERDSRTPTPHGAAPAAAHATARR
jgi:hypothetical protein